MLRATVSALAFSAAVGTLPYSVTSPSIVSTCTLATETPSVVRSAVLTFVVTHASGIESARAPVDIAETARMAAAVRLALPRLRQSFEMN